MGAIKVLLHIPAIPPEIKLFIILYFLFYGLGSPLSIKTIIILIYSYNLILFTVGYF